MKRKVLNFNQVDSVGDSFSKGSIKFKNPVKVLRDFNNSELLFTVDIYEYDDGIYADFPEDKSIIGLYPAIGYKTVKREIHFELFAIGLSESENLDQTILPL